MGSQALRDSQFLKRVAMAAPSFAHGPTASCVH